MVTHSIFAGPKGSKKHLKRTLESAKIMGESLHKRAKLVAEDKYVMAVKLASGDPAQGIVTDNKLNLVNIKGEILDACRKQLPWVQEGSMKNNIFLYPREETLEGSWSSRHNNVKIRIIRSGGNTFSSQIITEIILSSSFLHLSVYEREDLILDIGWHSRAHPLITSVIIINKNEENFPLRTIFKKYVKNMTNPVKSKAITEMLGPIEKIPGVDTLLRRHNKKNLTKLKVGNFEYTLPRDDPTLVMDENIIVKKAGKRIIAFDADRNTFPIKKPSLLTIDYQTSKEDENLMKLMCTIYHLTNLAWKELRTYELHQELRKLGAILQEIGLTYSSGNCRHKGCFISLLKEKTTKLDQLKLCMGMGPIGEAIELYKDADIQFRTGKFTFQGRIRSYKESVNAISFHKETFYYMGLAVHPELPINIKNSYVFTGFCRLSEGEVITPISDVIRFSPDCAIISVGNNLVRIIKNSLKNGNQEEQIKAHQDEVFMDLATDLTDPDIGEMASSEENAVTYSESDSD